MYQLYVKWTTQHPPKRFIHTAHFPPLQSMSPMPSIESISTLSSTPSKESMYCSQYHQCNQSHRNHLSHQCHQSQQCHFLVGRGSSSSSSPSPPVRRGGNASAASRIMHIKMSKSAVAVMIFPNTASWDHGSRSVACRNRSQNSPTV